MPGQSQTPHSDSQSQTKSEIWFTLLPLSEGLREDLAKQREQTYVIARDRWDVPLIALTWDFWYLQNLLRGSTQLITMFWTCQQVTCHPSEAGRRKSALVENDLHSVYEYTSRLGGFSIPMVCAAPRIAPAPPMSNCKSKASLTWLLALSGEWCYDPTQDLLVTSWYFLRSTAGCVASGLKLTFIMSIMPACHMETLTTLFVWLHKYSEQVQIAASRSLLQSISPIMHITHHRQCTIFVSCI